VTGERKTIATKIAGWLGASVSVTVICTFLQMDASSRQEQKTAERDHWEAQQRYMDATDKHLGAIDDKLGSVQQQMGNTAGKVDTMMRFMGARPRPTDSLGSPATDAKTRMKTDGHSSVDSEPFQAKNKPQTAGTDLMPAANMY